MKKITRIENPSWAEAIKALPVLRCNIKGCADKPETLVEFTEDEVTLALCDTHLFAIMTGGDFELDFAALPQHRHAHLVDDGSGVDGNVEYDPDLWAEANKLLKETKTILCKKCGATVYLDSGWANECEGCGTEYNGRGQMLAPRSQWGEETGERF